MWRLFVLAQNQRSNGRDRIREYFEVTIEMGNEKVAQFSQMFISSDLGSLCTGLFKMKNIAH